MSALKKDELTLPLHSRELPATQGMLHLVRTELKADIRGLRSEMKSGFRQMDSKFEQVDSRFSLVDSKLEHMNSKIEQIASDVARISLLMEEQNSRNQFTLEALTGLFNRQERVESRVNRIEDLVKVFVTQGRG